MERRRLLKRRWQKDAIRQADKHGFSRGLDAEDYELAALALVVGMLEALDKLPPDGADALLSLLAEEDEAAKQGHRRRVEKGRRNGHRR